MNLWSYEKTTRGNENGNCGKYGRRCVTSKLCKTFQFWSQVRFPCLTPAFSTQQEKSRFLHFSPVGLRFCFPFFALEHHWNTDTDTLVTRDEPFRHYIFTTTRSTSTTFIIALTPRFPLQSCPAQKMVQPCFSALNSQPISFGRR